MLGRNFTRKSLKVNNRLMPMVRGHWDAPDVPIRTKYEVRRKVRLIFFQGLTWVVQSMGD
jgi:hypothetical protein